MSRLNALVVGLGNYTHPLTRHSISQLTLENIHNLLNHHHRYNVNSVASASPTSHEEALSRLQSVQSGSDLSNHLKISKPNSAWIAKHDFQSFNGTSPINLTLHLLKPRAAMNISGPIVQSYHSQLSKSGHPTKLIIIHDELDLKPLVVRLKRPPQSSKHKGHNGLRSVFASLRAYSPQNLYTIGIGVGRDVSNPSKDPGDVGRWVLSPLTRPEIEACSWDVEDSPSSNPQHRGSVVLEAWKQILEIIRN
ncbi:hypothetical protein PGTUg99_026033 [Puccinia graminis f. sp. tritici]|uniref:Peptidyl-tRNA hydrolase n=1 Tax=Puccinia graminis f. sp. tritici TaxID=56615 RepID=A0A5B0S5N1_PUCGR|nr:hypothetical protein PGTUg99_026033 [Puccinia graminis f. sp. tritici]